MPSLIKLDLSRNELSSLKGLDSILALESLNSYYNKIVDLKEILHLQVHTKLKSLDLRLNPVSRNQYYRRFVCIHVCVCSYVIYQHKLISNCIIDTKLCIPVSYTHLTLPTKRIV